jgi:hypothetical protein
LIKSWKDGIMKKPLLFISIFVFLVSAACGITPNFGFKTIVGSGKIVTESREVSDFTRVEVCCGMELYLTQGETESLEIEADDNFMEEITTQVINGSLVVKYRQQTNVSYQPSQSVILTLTMPEVRGVSLSGGGYFETEAIDSEGFDLGLSGGSDAQIGELVTGDITVDISGGGRLRAGSIKGAQVDMGFSGGSDAQIESLVAVRVDVDNSGGGQFEADACQVDQLDLNFSGSSDGKIASLTAEKLTLRASGGGATQISGMVVEQEVDLSGGSTYKAADLESEVTLFSASGGGDSTVWVTEALNVQLSGGSGLGYYGDPQIFNPSLSGGSEIAPLGEK